LEKKKKKDKTDHLFWEYSYKNLERRIRREIDSSPVTSSYLQEQEKKILRNLQNGKRGSMSNGLH
jgi:hypothetical protein